MRIWILVKLMHQRPDEQTVLVASGLDIVTNLLTKSYPDPSVVSMQEGEQRGWWDVFIAHPDRHDSHPWHMYRIEQRDLCTSEPIHSLGTIAPRLYPSPVYPPVS